LTTTVRVTVTGLITGFQHAIDPGAMRKN